MTANKSTDAEYEVVSTVPTVPRRSVVTADSVRRYNWLKIAWQLYAWGWLLTVAFCVLLEVFGPRGWPKAHPSSLDAWEHAFVVWVAGHLLAVLGLFALGLAALAVAAEIVRRRR